MNYNGLWIALDLLESAVSGWRIELWGNSFVSFLYRLGWVLEGRIVLKRDCLRRGFPKISEGNGLAFKDWAGSEGVSFWTRPGETEVTFVLPEASKRDWMSG